MIDGELRRVDALCGDLSKPTFRARSVAGAESPKRFASFVPTEGWTPLDASPHISSVSSVIERLGGYALYGGDEGSDVPFRELLANAVDATRIRRAVTPKASIPPVQVALASDENRDSLVVRDFGIGMSGDDMVTYLCDFGNSGWRDRPVRDALPGALSSGFSVTGRFGIGFFSVFMVADRVTVTSRPLQSSWDDTMVLEFRNGAAVRPLLRAAEKSERLQEPGTEVKLYLRHRLGSDKGMFEAWGPTWMSDLRLLVTVLRQQILMLDVDVDVIPVGTDEPVRLVDANYWTSVDPGALFDDMNWRLWALSPGEAAEHRETFTRLLKPIVSPDGKTVGRLALKTESLEGNLYEDAPARIYCGGFGADSIFELSGVLAGTPDRAARDRAKSDVPLSSFQDWFQSVIDEASSSNLLIGVDGLVAQSVGIHLGVVAPDLPVAVGHAGSVVGATLLSELASRDRAVFFVASTHNIRMDSNEPGFSLYTRNDFVRLQEGQYLVPSGLTGVYRPLPRRADELAERWQDWKPVAGVGFDPIAWWRRDFDEPLAEACRIAAAAWGIPLEEVVTNMRYHSGYESSAETAQIITASGRRARVAMYELVRHAEAERRPA